MFIACTDINPQKSYLKCQLDEVKTISLTTTTHTPFSSISLFHSSSIHIPPPPYILPFPYLSLFFSLSLSLWNSLFLSSFTNFANFLYLLLPTLSSLSPFPLSHPSLSLTIPSPSFNFFTLPTLFSLSLFLIIALSVLSLVLITYYPILIPPYYNVCYSNTPLSDLLLLFLLLFISSSSSSPILLCLFLLHLFQISSLFWILLSLWLPFLTWKVE